MKKQLYLITLIAIQFGFNATLYGQNAVTFCETKKDVKSKNLAVREGVYETIRLVNSSKISKKEKSILKTEYSAIKDSFNSIYKQMVSDKRNFASNKLLCERYGDELSRLAVAANNFNTKASNKINKKTAGFGIGVGEIAAALKLVYEGFNRHQEAFYKDVKWDEWDDILKTK